MYIWFLVRLWWLCTENGSVQVGVWPTTITKTHQQTSTFGRTEPNDRFSPIIYIYLLLRCRNLRIIIIIIRTHRSPTLVLCLLILYYPLHIYVLCCVLCETIYALFCSHCRGFCDFDEVLFASYYSRNVCNVRIMLHYTT